MCRKGRHDCCKVCSHFGTTYEVYIETTAARVSVQFQSIVERLTPHDTIFTFIKSSELQDSVVLSACSLHTAASIKSKDASPHRGLAGITEDASESRNEHNQSETDAEATGKGNVRAELSSEDHLTRPINSKGRNSEDGPHKRSQSIASQNTYRPRTMSDTNKALPPPPEDSTLDDTDTRSTRHYRDYSTRPSVGDRYSSQSARPSPRELHDAYENKPKVKLGPRPSMESQKAVDGTHRTSEFRPVASLPAGLRMPGRKVVSGRPISRQSQTTSPERILPKELPPPLPMTPIAPVQIPDRKLSIQSNGLPSPLKTPDLIAPKMTPEKRRLMKALEIRQRQMAMSKNVNGLGIGMKSGNQARSVDGLEPEKDIPRTSVESEYPDENHNAAHIAERDINKGASRDVEASPISIAETSEGPSTQASSFTDEEEIPIEKDQEAPVNPKLTTSELQENSAQSNFDPLELLNNNRTTSSPIISRKEDVINGELPIENSNSLGQESLSDPPRTQDQMEQSPVGAEVQRCPAEEDLVCSKNPPKDVEERAPETDKATSEIAQDSSIAGSNLLSGNATLDSVVNHDHEERAILFSKEGTTPSVSGEGKHSANEPDQMSPEAPAPDSINTLHTEPLQESSKTSIGAPESLENEINPRPAPSTGNGQESSSLHSMFHVYPAATDTQTLLSPASRGRDIGSEVIEPLQDKDIVSVAPLQASDDDLNPSVEPSDHLPPATAVKRAPSRKDPGLSLPLIETKQLSQDSDTTAMPPPSPEDASELQTGRSLRRQGVINPIARISSAEQSDEHYLSDDAFMDELNSATVQEAKPMSVSKSPIKPVFPRTDSQQRLIDTKTLRSVSSPMDHHRKNGEVSPSRRPPTATSIRSVSVSHKPRPDDQPPSMPKKIGVSSGISQRIKALEQSRQVNRPLSPQSPSAPPNTSAFLNLRMNTQRSPPPAASTLDRKQSTQSRPSTAYPSPSPSPDYVKWNPFSQSKRTKVARPESVSVTATIIRDATNMSAEKPVNLSEPRAIELHRSPLVVQHENNEKMPPPPPPLSPLKPPRPRYARYSSARSGSSSSTDQTQIKEKPPNSRRDSFASIRSKSSRTGSEAELPRSMSDSSIGSAGSPDGSRDDKKDSKRNRLLKRMSSISSMSRRSIAHALSPGPKEGPILESQEPVAEAPVVSSLVEVGDVNIQFPDTLVGFPFTSYDYNLADRSCSSGRGDICSSTSKVSWSWQPRNQTM